MLKATSRATTVAAARVITSPIFDLSLGFIALVSFSVIDLMLTLHLPEEPVLVLEASGMLPAPLAQGSAVAIAVSSLPKKNARRERRAKEIPLDKCHKGTGYSRAILRAPFLSKVAVADSQWRASWLEHPL
jgi:hypothetical protein